MIREATLRDLDQIWQLRLETTELLKERDIDQWQYADPSLETIKRDISLHEFFVDEEEGFIRGMIAIKGGIEKTYNVIYDGKWNADEPYLTVHRLAVKRNLLGQLIALNLMLFAEQHALNLGIHYIRIDTHEKNRYAIKLFTSLNYLLCGYILLVQDQGDLRRLAFDKQF
jgi:ribosomal protein S18 acetylase RimI-like enzyme